MSASDSLIKWKTDAWKDPSMVAWYAGRMVEHSGTVRLNNALEIGYCAQFAHGKRILDVGIGTGRASLPLARQGYDVTGIDSSKAMLDETARQAGAIPIHLLEGDVRDLPVPDATFDTVMALNVMTHFPNWHEILEHWVSKAVEGGRIIFDVYSLDHNCAATGQDIQEKDLLPNEQNFAAFNLRIKVEDLIAEADRQGLTVKAVVPYRTFMTGTDSNLFIRPTLDGENRWERLLTWLAEDDAMMDFALLLERDFSSHLTSVISGKLMLVLEKTPNPKANAKWLERNRKCNEMLRSGMTLQDFAKHSGQAPDELKTKLNAGLNRLRNRYFFYRIVKPIMLKFSPKALASYLTSEHHSAITQWFNAEQADDLATFVAENWSKNIGHTKLSIAGVDIGPSIGYGLIPSILINCYDFFKGKRS